jgi:hypothetical protein
MGFLFEDKLAKKYSFSHNWVYQTSIEHIISSTFGRYIKNWYAKIMENGNSLNIDTWIKQFGEEL